MASLSRSSPLVASVLLVVAGSMLPITTPHAQAALEEVVVRGQRLAQERSIERRRESEAFVDAVSSDDIGRLPDKNAAEALDRIAGVSVTIDQGEGRFVSIRGVNPALNNFTINGVSAGSPEADGADGKCRSMLSAASSCSPSK